MSLNREDRIRYSPDFRFIEILDYLLGSAYSLNYPAQPQAIPNLIGVVDRLDITSNT